jgi:hypothetical protein
MDFDGLGAGFGGETEMQQAATRIGEPTSAGFSEKRFRLPRRSGTICPSL